MEDSDKIAVQVSQGSKQAEQQLFRILRVRFTIVAKQRMGGEEAEDIAHDACVTVLEKIREQPPPANFYAWAYEILRKKIGNFYQKNEVRRRNGMIHRALGASDLSCLPVSDPDIYRRLMNCIRKLIRHYPMYARALNLIYQGYKTDEICGKLGVKPGYLYVILGRGRKLLRECLVQGGEHR